MFNGLKVAVVFLCVGLIGTLGVGCAPVGQSIERLGSMRDQAAEIQSDLQTQLDELALMRESIPDGSEQGLAVESMMAQVGAKLAVVEAAIVHADQVIEGVKNPSDPLTIAADAVSPWVPAPVQAPLVLGAALLASVMRSRSLSSGTRSIIESINYVLKKDDSFKAAFVANADTIRTIQTPGARKIVNKWTA
jgi:hypothetical protein